MSQAGQLHHTNQAGSVVVTNYSNSILTGQKQQDKTANNQEINNNNPTLKSIISRGCNSS